ncbi:MAG TPA: Pvc16 family protein [Chthoniobacterales bacterium]
MAFGNLADVTSALIVLLEAYMNGHLQQGLGPDVTVLPMRPDRIDPGLQNRLSLHLYHVNEDPYYKNAIGEGNDPPNVAKAPMSLCLFYILTAHHNDGQSAADALRQQEMMGMALKTFHDNPVITDHTAIPQPNGTSIQILPPNLRNRNNSIQVIFRPVSPEDAVGFWTTEDQQLTTLSAYYEVRVIFLEPELPRTVPGIVLSLGAYLQQLGSPDLRTSTSAMRFTLPAIAGGGQPPPIEASPARAVLDDRVNPPAEHRRFRLLGTNLAIGRSRMLILRNSRWQVQPAPIDEAPVDLSLNPNWSVRFTTSAVEVEFRSTLDVRTPGGIVQTLNVLPGIYSARVQVVTEQTVLLGQLKQIVSASNETAFAIVPRIVSFTVAGGNILVDLGPEFDLTTLTFNSDNVRVSLAGVAYTQTTIAPIPNPGEFSVSGPNQVTLRPHTGLNLAPVTPEAHSFRLIVNGAESPPFWIELP